jgi:hypothetical protein
MNKLLLIIIICVIIYIIFFQKKIQFSNQRFGNTRINSEILNFQNLFYNKISTNIEKYCENGFTDVEIQIPDYGIKIIYWTVSNSNSNFNNSGIANINNGIAIINIQCLDDNDTYIYFRIVNKDDTLSKIYKQKVQ